MYIFSTLPQRGFGHHPPTVSAAPGRKVGPGKVASVALHRRPGNTKNDRPTAPVVPFVVLWFCFPLRFTGTTTPSHLSIAPTKFAPSFLSPSFSKPIPPHPHSFTHFAGFRHSFFSPTAYICNFSLTRNQIHSRRLDISSPSAISGIPYSIKRTALAFCFNRAVAHRTARFFPDILFQDALPTTPRDPGRRAVGCRRH